MSKTGENRNLWYNAIMAKIMPKTIFIVGLGNPGEQYQNTPHSAGFMVIDEFARRFEFGPFKMEPDGIMVSQKEIEGANVILAKPQMFMNNSGKAVAKLFKYRKIRLTKSYPAEGEARPIGRPALWIVNDDLDIPLGKIKIAKNRGSAGHKGVQSVIDQLKTKNFTRFRVGIQTPEVAAKTIPSDKFVLKKITPKEQPIFTATTDTAANALSCALAKGLESAMTEFNQ